MSGTIHNRSVEEIAKNKSPLLKYGEGAFDGEVGKQAESGITARTTDQRWTQGGALRADARPTAVRPTPAHALTEDKRQAVSYDHPEVRLCRPAAGSDCSAPGRSGGLPGLKIDFLSYAATDKIRARER